VAGGEGVGARNAASLEAENSDTMQAGRNASDNAGAGASSRLSDAHEKLGGVNLKGVNIPTSNSGDFVASSPGVIVYKSGNYWVKTVDDNANIAIQLYGSASIKAQAKGLNKLGDMAPSFVYTNNKLVTRDAGAYQKGKFWSTWWEGSKRLGTPMNDIRVRNIGSNDMIFDPSLDPISRGVYWGAAALGGYSIYDAVIDE
jgi:hypothetical protein